MMYRHLLWTIGFVAATPALGQPPDGDPLLKDLAPRRDRPAPTKPASEPNKAKPAQTTETERLRRAVLFHMQQAAEALASGQTQRAVQHQTRALAALAELAPSAGPTRRTPFSAPRKGTSGGTAQPQKAAPAATGTASKSTGRGPEATPPTPRAGIGPAREETLKRLWTRLPPQAQQHLRAIRNVPLLPGFEEAISAFYRRIAD
ncbi:MAG TPA: hypothetical protein ENJ62_05615 [Bryobacterales bacterium]|nr:hypothetical protein [Bryobacterales bacterium]